MTGIRQTKNIPRGTHNRRDSSAEPHRGNHIADTNGRAIRSIACARFEPNPTTRPCENAIIRLLAAHSHAESRASPSTFRKAHPNKHTVKSPDAIDRHILL